MGGERDVLAVMASVSPKGQQDVRMCMDGDMWVWGVGVWGVGFQG